MDIGEIFVWIVNVLVFSAIAFLVWLVLMLSNTPKTATQQEDTKNNIENED